MKAQELMLGDIVTFKDCQNDKEPVIIKIWSINQDGESFAFIDGDESLDEIVIDDEIVGLPLTPEILEKNGFVYESKDQLFKDIYPRISMLYAQYRLVENGYINYGEMPEIKYVHQLQHALRLCGIEKTIEL